jgi:integrase
LKSKIILSEVPIARHLSAPFDPTHSRPRKAGIWWNAGKNAYYVKIAGKQTRLSADHDEAQTMFEQLRRQEHAPDLQDRNTVRTVFNLYLDYIERDHAESYKTCAKYLQSFLDFHKEVRVGDLRAAHIHKWITAHPTWGQSSQYSAIGWVVSALNWAAKPENRYITTNPIRGMSKPPVRSRGEEAVIDPEDHKKLYEAANPSVKQILLALQQTGTRPSNLCRITAADCDFSNGVVTLARHKTARKTGTPLKIPMTTVFRELLKELCAKYPEGPIFRTIRGEPWQSQYISEVVGRLRKQVGMTERLTPYNYRHNTATQLLLAGVPDAHVAQILGHTNTAMLHKHYGHLSKFMKPLVDALDNVVNKPASGGESSEGKAGAKR